MLKIRLTRIGKKNSPFFRVVLTEHTAPPKGKFLEALGSYDPKLKKIVLNKERILYWLSCGAQASVTVHNILVREKVIKGPKKAKKISLNKNKKEEDKKEKPADKPEKVETPEKLATEEKAEKEKPAEASKEEASPEKKEDGK